MESSSQSSIAPPQTESTTREPASGEFVLGAGLDFADPNCRLAPLYLRKSHVVAVMILALVFVLMSYLQVWHTDLWGHLRFGEYIVQQRQLPRHEMFSGSFADQEATYVNYQWIAQAGFYLVFDLGRELAAPDFEHRLGGGTLLLCAAHATVVILRFFVLLLVFRRLTGSLPFALVGVGMVFVMSLFCHLRILRPQILGELAFAALLLALSRPVLSRRALVLVPLVMVLWANCHGSFPIGFVLLGTALAGQVLAVVSGQWSVVRGQRRDLAVRLHDGWRALRGDGQSWRLVGVLTLSLVAAALLNPHGPRLFLYSWELANHPNIRFMEEWKPLPLKSAAGYVFLASVLLLIPVLRWSPVRFTPMQGLLLIGFGFQTLAHARVLVWWIMVFPWVVLPHLQALYRRYLPPVLEETGRADLRKTILAVLAGGALLGWSAPVQWLCWREAPLASQRVTPETPLRAAAYLKEEYQKDQKRELPRLKRCVFASETLGDYLLWDLRLNPPVHVSCYTHVHLFTPAHWLDCFTVKSGGHGWQAALDRLGVQFLVVEPDLHPHLAEQVRAASGQWEIVAEEPILVARRK